MNTLCNHKIEKIYIIPYTVTEDKKSIMLEKLENEWIIINDYFNLCDLKSAMWNQLEKILNDKQINDIMNFIITVIITNFPSTYSEQKVIDEFFDVWNKYELEKYFKCYIDILVLNQLMKSINNDHKMVTILKIYQQSNINNIKHMFYKLLDSNVKTSGLLLILEKYNFNFSDIKPYLEKFTDNKNNNYTYIIPIINKKLMAKNQNLILYISDSLNILLQQINNIIQYNKHIINDDKSQTEEYIKIKEKLKKSILDSNKSDIDNKSIYAILNSLNYTDYINLCNVFSSKIINIYSLKRILEKYKLDTPLHVTIKKTNITSKSNKLDLFGGCNTYYFLKYDNNYIINHINECREQLIPDILDGLNKIDKRICYINDILDKTITVHPQIKNILKMHTFV